MIDINKPLEAVHKATGRVVPMAYDRPCLTAPFGFFTKECPCPQTSNSGWHDDGRDHCGANQWFIRNVAAPALDLTKPVQTRDGRKARILSTDLKAALGTSIVVALTRLCGAEIVATRRPDGRRFGSRESGSDIINAPEETHLFLNVYPNGESGVLHFPKVFANSPFQPNTNGHRVKLTYVDGKPTKAELLTA